MQGIATVTLRISSAARSEATLAARLRAGQPSIVPRVRDGAVVLDLRTVLDEQDQSLCDAVISALG